MSRKMVSMAVGIALFVASFAGRDASAALLSINADFNGGTGFSAAATGVGTTWNNVTANGPTTLNDSNGNPTSVTLSLNTLVGNGGSFGTGSPGGTAPFAPILYDNYVYAFGTGTNYNDGSSYALSNLPAGTYDLYLYSMNGNGGGPGPDAKTGFTDYLNANTYPVSTPYTSGVLEADNTKPGTSSSFVNGGNYVEFTGLSVASLGTITGAFFSIAGGGTLNGLQLVQVPEPSSFVLIGMGLATLVAVRRRRR